MNARTFVDTNVLIYAHDTDAEASRQPRRVSCASFGANGMAFSAHRSCRNFT